MTKKPVLSTISPEAAQVIEEHNNEVKSVVQDTNDQLDTDRSKLDQILVKSGTTVLQLETLLNNLDDFRKSIKQIAKNTIKTEVAKAVETELNKIRLENPDKVIIIYRSFWHWLFRRK